MGRNFSLIPACGTRLNQIPEWFCLRDATETTSAPFAEIVLHPTFARLAKQTPRFPTRLGHHRHFCELLMRVLWAIATTKCLYNANDFTALLKSGGNERLIDEV